jgi:PAS domain S-box-containing protein
MASAPPGRTRKNPATPAANPIEQIDSGRGARSSLGRIGVHQARFLAAIVESAEDAIFAKTLAGTILTWNAGAQRIYGYRPEDIVGQPVHRLAPPDKHAEIDGILRKLAAGTRIEHFETERVRGNGERFPVSLSISPVLGDNGEIIGASTVSRDITENRRLLASERIRMAQLRALVAAIEDAAFVFDSDGHALLRNRAARTMLPGVERLDELTKALEAAVDSASTGFGPQDAALDEYPIRIGDSTHWVRRSTHSVVMDPSDETRSTSVHPPGRSFGSLVLLRDITEIRDARASREAFVGILSHELRTPITTIFGAAKMLQRPRVGPERAELLHDIEAESDRLYRLVEDLLVLTRIERESLEITQEPVVLAPLIQRVAVAERNRLPGVHLDIEIGNNLPMVRGEPTYVEQILRNLVSNAVKYGPADGVVRVLAERAGQAALVRVQDEGPGIASGESDRVFDLLYRSPATAAQAAGSGIGLFVSRRLAEAMGGRITARPRPERGAEFCLELQPYVDVADASDEDAVPAREHSSGVAPTDA